MSGAFEDLQVSLGLVRKYGKNGGGVAGEKILEAMQRRQKPDHSALPQQISTGMYRAPSSAPLDTGFPPVHCFSRLLFWFLRLCLSSPITESRDTAPASTLFSACVFSLALSFSLMDSDTRDALMALNLILQP